MGSRVRQPERGSGGDDQSQKKHERELGGPSHRRFLVPVAAVEFPELTRGQKIHQKRVRVSHHVRKILGSVNLGLKIDAVFARHVQGLVSVQLAAADVLHTVAAVARYGQRVDLVAWSRGVVVPLVPARQALFSVQRQSFRPAQKKPDLLVIGRSVLFKRRLAVLGDCARRPGDVRDHRIGLWREHRNMIRNRNRNGPCPVVHHGDKKHERHEDRDRVQNLFFHYNKRYMFFFSIRSPIPHF
jgi:hypothetical protein